MIEIKEKTKKETNSLIQKKLNLSNPMEVPVIEKIFINIGIGKFVSQKSGKEQQKICQQIMDDLSLIIGQQPFIFQAKKSIANFKIRKGMPVGIGATLRKKKAYNFLSRLVNTALPRVRDFQGLSLKSINEKGDLNIGIKEHIIFPEIKLEDIKLEFGFQVTVILKNIQDKNQAIKFYKLLHVPLKVEQ